MTREEHACNTHWEINRKTHLRLWTGGHQICLTAAEERQFKTIDLEKKNLVSLSFYKSMRTKIGDFGQIILAYPRTEGTYTSCASPLKSKLELQQI